MKSSTEKVSKGKKGWSIEQVRKKMDNRKKGPPMVEYKQYMDLIQKIE